MTELPSIDDVSRASATLGLGASPAELHGGLCGWLAAGGAPGNDWPARVLADDALQPVAEGSALAQLLEVTIKQLEDRDFGFELLLSDSTETEPQVDALFTWARAFLGGFGLGSGHKRPALSEEGEEALNDLAKLAQLIPVIGAPVGAVVNWRLTTRLATTAMNAYRLRWFEDEHLT